MIKKLIISAATVATLVLGTNVMTAAPAEAGIHIGFCGGIFGCGPYYGGGYYGGPYYGDPYYGYGYHRHFHHHWRHAPPVHCWWQTIRHHHHWVQRRVCRPAYY